ncbi:MAG: hypothetical protein H0T71_08035, partial [Acidobacteria bacterium]|nr:hypothetical protein [Acidobacteriota bacterium]
MTMARGRRGSSSITFTSAGIEVPPAKDVAQWGAEGFGFGGGERDMRADNGHRWLLLT